MGIAFSMFRHFKISFAVSTLVACTLLCGCEGYDPFSYELDSKGWDIEKSEHFIYHYFPSDTCFTSPEQANSEVLACLEELEDFLDWFSEFFRVDFSSQEIYYYKYPTIDDMRDILGEGQREGWSCAGIHGRREIHAAHKIHRHEVVHIVSWEINFLPPPILDEGIAERYGSGDMSSQVLHERVAHIISTEKFVPLESGITRRQFTEIDRSERSYPFRTEVASWTAYVIDSYGIDKFRDLFERTDGCCWSENNIMNTVQEVCGKTFSDMESEWIAFITGKCLQPRCETIVCRTECENH